LTLLAGTDIADITPRLGVELIGYFNRPGSAAGVHDPLKARALVLDDGATAIALVSVELLWLRGRAVTAIRRIVGECCALNPEHVFIFCTHTHGGPAPHTLESWDYPLYERIADAIVSAYESRQPARLGTSAGQLYGYSINRRWLDRPIDPSVGVIRVDRADGSPLAILSNFACHAVVMGYDNVQITGDWAGYSSRLLEEALGNGALALFAQGGAGDINPLTESVRQRLEAGHPVAAIGDVSFYYGYTSDAPDAWNIGDRGGGTFLECETLARAYNSEVLRVWHGITPQGTAALWYERAVVDAGLGDDEPPAAGLPPALISILSEDIGATIPLEIGLVGIGDSVLVGQPGEIFSETAIGFRKLAQGMGYRHAMLLSYANGCFAYIPPASAFPEGGYEVNWPLGLGISLHTQDRITRAVTPILQAHAAKSR
jgi:neutral ceramidase